MGVNKERIIVTTFVIGGILAGAAALFYVMMVPSGVIYNGGFILGIKAFAAAVLGGIGNVRGALLGGLLLGVIGNYGQILLGDAQWTDVVAFVVLVLVLMVRPEGILGTSLGRSAHEHDRRPRSCPTPTAQAGHRRPRRLARARRGRVPAAPRPLERPARGVPVGVAADRRRDRSTRCRTSTSSRSRPSRATTGRWRASPWPVTRSSPSA